jgi:hypothetical protein
MKKGEGTTVWGSSDDLVEFEGDVYGEVGCHGTDDRDTGILVVFSDGTVLDIKYGKSDLAIWGITVLRRGDLLIGVEQCTSDTDDRYSDVATFKPGLTWARVATEWKKVH